MIDEVETKTCPQCGETKPLCLECNVKKHTRIEDYRPFQIQIECPHNQDIVNSARRAA